QEMATIALSWNFSPLGPKPATASSRRARRASARDSRNPGSCTRYGPCSASLRGLLRRGWSMVRVSLVTVTSAAAISGCRSPGSRATIKDEAPPEEATCPASPDEALRQAASLDLAEVFATLPPSCFDAPPQGVVEEAR